MLDRMQKRLAREEGFTLIELLVVIVIIGILLAIAVPSYLGFTSRANDKAAAADVRSGFNAAEAYYSDNGNYTAMDVGTVTPPVGLLGIDAGVKIDKVTVTGGGAGYTLCKIVGNKMAIGTGPAHTIVTSDAPNPAVCP